MNGFIVKKSPEEDEYIRYSTVVDAPAEYYPSLEAMKERILWRGPSPGELLDFKLMVERLRETGTSSLFGHHKFNDNAKFWWRENAPENYGEALIDEESGEPTNIRLLTREELFDAVKERIL